MGNRMRAYGAGEVERIVAWLKGQPGAAAKRDLLQLYLSIAWAMRAGEERQLRVSDFFGRGWAWREWAEVDAKRVKRTFRDPDNPGRRVGRAHRYRIGPEVRAVVSAWLSEVRALRPVRFSDPLFSMVGRPVAISREYMWRRVKRWCRGAGVPTERRGTHSGRKTGAGGLKCALERDARRERKRSLREGRPARARDAGKEATEVTHHASSVELDAYLAEPDEELRERIWRLSAAHAEELAGCGWTA